MSSSGPTNHLPIQCLLKPKEPSWNTPPYCPACRGFFISSPSNKKILGNTRIFLLIHARMERPYSFPVWHLTEPTPFAHAPIHPAAEKGCVTGNGWCFLERLCHSIWLLHLHNTVKIQTFYQYFPFSGIHSQGILPVIPSELQGKKHQPFSRTQPLEISKE